MSDKPEGPPVLRRAATFAGEGVGRAAEVTPEAALAADLRLEGRLEAASALRLAFLAAANQAAGRLDLECEGVRYVLFFRKGTPEHASSSDPADDLGAYLVRRGVAQAEQIADAEKAKGGFGGDLVTSLAGLRIIDPARSFQVLQEHGVGLFARALALDRGSFRWAPKEVPPASSFPLGPRFGLVCDAARRLDGLTLRRRLAPRLGLVPSRSGGRVAISDLRLTAQEARLAGLFDGVRTLAEVARGAGGEADALLRVALLLAETDLLAFGAPRAPSPASPAPEPAAAPPAEPPPPAASPRRAMKAGPAAPPAPARAAVTSGPARPTPPGTPQATRDEPITPVPRTDLATLRAALERIQNADHFAVLGVPRGASTAQIKSAYFALARAWHPDAAAPGDAPEAKRLRADLFGLAGQAWGILGDEAKRKQYLEDLETGAATPVDAAKIFEAENLFQRATVLVKTRQYSQALADLAKAVQLNADEPEFHVWRAWVRFLTGTDRRAELQPRSAEVEAALVKNPRCMAGYLFLGQMAKISGDIPLAERHLRRGLAIDEDNVELQRELKYLRK